MRCVLVATPEQIDWARQREHERGCDCPCELVTDPERVRSAADRRGISPDDPKLIVFYHPFTCTASRINWAPWN